MASNYFILLLFYFICIGSYCLPTNNVTFRFANHYSHHMVLQRAPNSAVVWGFGEEQMTVMLHIHNQRYYTKVEQDSRGLNIWKIVLDPYPAGGPYLIEASSIVQNAQVTVKLNDVYFGDVWICGGQSNMEFPIQNAYTGQQELNVAPLYPQIRLFTVNRYASDKPVFELDEKHIDQQWSLPTGSIGGFSAVCWMFGRRLFDLHGIPLGLINTNYPGSPVESWSSPETNRKCNGRSLYDDATSAFYDDVTNSFYDDSTVDPNSNSALYNAMIFPLLNMTIYGVIWYQGEQNANYRPDFYDCTFPAMIEGWRKEWLYSTLANTDPSFPFGFVQLSAVCNNTLPKVPLIRWKQTAEYGHVPNPHQWDVFMAVAMDLPDGSLDSYHCVHSRHKADIAHRLVLGAQAIAYKKTLVYWSGPVAQEAVQIDGNIKITFTEFSLIDDGIEIRQVSGFEIKSHDGDWIKVNIATHSNKEIYVETKNITVVNEIRYAWADEPCQFKSCAIYSKKSGLPCAPFVAPVNQK